MQAEIGPALRSSEAAAGAWAAMLASSVSTSFVRTASTAISASAAPYLSAGRWTLASGHGEAVTL